MKKTGVATAALTRTHNFSSEDLARRTMKRHAAQNVFRDCFLAPVVTAAGAYRSI